MTTKRQLRARLRGADVFERRAIKDAIRSIDTGASVSPLTRRRLEAGGGGPVRNPDGLLARSAPQLPDRLAAGRKSLFEQRGSAFSQPGLDGPNRKQAEFGARTSALTGRPFSDFQRRELGINKDNEDDFRSLLKRRR